MTYEPEESLDVTVQETGLEDMVNLSKSHKEVVAGTHVMTHAMAQYQTHFPE